MSENKAQDTSAGTVPTVSTDARFSYETVGVLELTPDQQKLLDERTGGQTQRLILIRSLSEPTGAARLNAVFCW